MISPIAFFVAVLLVVATAAPLVRQKSLVPADVLVDKISKTYVASGSRVKSDVRLPSLKDQGTPLIVTTKKSGDDILATLLTTMRSVRVTRGLPENMKVTMDEKTATNARMVMEKINEDLKRDIESKSPKCGKAKITKSKLDNSIIPSYFYDVECQEKCDKDTKGARKFRPVQLETMYFQKVDSDIKDQYEIKFRKQVVGCCLEELDVKVYKSEHSETLGSPVRR